MGRRPVDGVTLSHLRAYTGAPDPEPSVAPDPEIVLVLQSLAFHAWVLGRSAGLR
jgi:hypothetical protein